MKIVGVYKIINIANNKFYIGSSNNIYKRWNEHKNDFNKGSHHSIYLQRAWDKYGEKNFKFKIIEKCTADNQFKREQYFIDYLKPYDKEIGYNICQNATGGGVYGEKNGFYGKNHFLKSRIKISSSRQYYNSNGDKNTNLNENIVSIIKFDLLKLNKKQVAKKYKVSFKTIDLIKQGITWDWVEKHLNERLKKAIIINGKNYSRKDIPTELQKEIIELYNKKITPWDIAKLGYSQRTVYRTLEQFSGYNPTETISKEDMKTRTNNIIKLHNLNYRNCDIEKELQLSRRIVQKTITQYKNQIKEVT